MTEFQRSTTSFRRQGSSGLIWDDKFITEQSNQEDNKPVEFRDREPTDHRSRSTGTTGRAYRTINVSSPTADPPSPKVSGCGLCGIFGKPVAANKPKSTKRSGS